MIFFIVVALHFPSAYSFLSILRRASLYNRFFFNLQQSNRRGAGVDKIRKEDNRTIRICQWVNFWQAIGNAKVVSIMGLGNNYSRFFSPIQFLFVIWKKTLCFVVWLWCFIGWNLRFNHMFWVLSYLILSEPWPVWGDYWDICWKVLSEFI